MPAHKILIVDDSADDRFLLQRKLKTYPECHVLGCAEDGRAAIDYLSGGGKFADRTQFPLPNVLLLDLKMPLVDGFEVLQWLGAHPMPLRVVVMSSSGFEEDVQRARILGAHDYLIKEEGVDKSLLALLNQPVSTSPQTTPAKIERRPEASTPLGMRHGHTDKDRPNYFGTLRGRTIRSSEPWIVLFQNLTHVEFATVDEARGFLEFYSRNKRVSTENPGKIYKFNSGQWLEENSG